MVFCPLKNKNSFLRNEIKKPLLFLSSIFSSNYLGQVSKDLLYSDKPLLFMSSIFSSNYLGQISKELLYSDSVSLRKLCQYLKY